MDTNEIVNRLRVLEEDILVDMNYNMKMIENPGLLNYTKEELDTELEMLASNSEDITIVIHQLKYNTRGFRESIASLDDVMRARQADTFKMKGKEKKEQMLALNRALFARDLYHMLIKLREGE